MKGCMIVDSSSRVATHRKYHPKNNCWRKEKDRTKAVLNGLRDAGLAERAMISTIPLNSVSKPIAVLKKEEGATPKFVDTNPQMTKTAQAVSEQYHWKVGNNFSILTKSQELGKVFNHPRTKNF